MSVLKGVMSYVRYLVNAEHQVDINFIKEKLSLFRFRPINDDSDNSLGFVPLLSEYDDDKSFELSDIVYDNKIAFSFRMDTIKLPKEILKVAIKKSYNAYQKQHNKWPDKIIRKELEMAESKNLKRKVLPKTKIIEAVWCLKSNQIRIFCRSSNALDKFIELFEQTFSFKLSKCDVALFSLKAGSGLDHFSDLMSLKVKPLFNSHIITDVN